MKRNDIGVFPGLREFLKDYPQMTIQPTTSLDLVMEGHFCFSAKPANGVEIIDTFGLRFQVPQLFPRRLPRVTEVEGKIPRNGDYHVNRDATLCLGSPLRLIYNLSKDPTLSGFAAKCLVPYLYAISHKLQFGGALPFSELAHETPGELQDYVDLFGLKRPEQAIRALQLLGMKKRSANKKACPCDCGHRAGNCKFNRILAEFRKISGRPWFRTRQ